MTTEAIEVIYYYKKKTNVTIKYIDKETGKNILETEIIHGHSGDEYTTTEKEIHDYQIVNISGKKSGKMENSDIEVIYYYEKIRGHSPQTGDNRNIVLWTTLCFVGLIGSIIVLIYMIKKRKNK